MWHAHGAVSNAMEPLGVRLGWWGVAQSCHDEKWRRSPIFTTGQLFLHSCLHFLGLHLHGHARCVKARTLGQPHASTN